MNELLLKCIKKYDHEGFIVGKTYRAYKGDSWYHVVDKDGIKTAFKPDRMREFFVEVI